jgi:large repetitive protein
LVNIPQGSYQFMLTDANNCTKSSPNISIQEPLNSVTISIDSIHNVSCKYGSDGDIFLKTTYGEAPFSYQWSKPATTTKGKLNGLLSGVYSVTVTDSLGCKSNLNFIPVPEPQALGILIDTVRQNACKDYNSGSIEVSGLGGVPPYSWKWSNGKISEDIFNLSNGLYKATLTDINKCIFLPTTDISIGSPDSLKVNVTTTLANMGLNNATASANVSGGKSPFSYKWSDTNIQTTQTAVNLAPGSYDVTVTDANKCVTIKKGNQIVSTTPEDLDLQALIKIYPNPTSGFLTVEYNFSSWIENTELVVFDLLGKNILHQNLFSASEKIDLDLNDLNCGVYWVGFRNENRVFGVRKVVVCR